MKGVALLLLFMSFSKIAYAQSNLTSPQSQQSNKIIEFETAEANLKSEVTDEGAVAFLSVVGLASQIQISKESIPLNGFKIYYNGDPCTLKVLKGQIYPSNNERRFLLKEVNKDFVVSDIDLNSKAKMPSITCNKGQEYLIITFPPEIELGEYLIVPFFEMKSNKVTAAKILDAQGFSICKN